jgi:hypothetical protein
VSGAIICAQTIAIAKDPMSLNDCIELLLVPDEKKRSCMAASGIAGAPLSGSRASTAHACGSITLWSFDLNQSVLLMPTC